MACPLCRLDERERLVVAETAHFMLLATEEPLVEGHLVLSPRAHVPALAALPASLDAELARLRQRAADALASAYHQPALLEEANLADSQAHARLHFLPGAAGLLAVVQAGRPLTYVESGAAARVAALRLVRYIDWQAGRIRALIAVDDGEAPGGLNALATALKSSPPPAGQGSAAARQLREVWQRHVAAAGESIEVVASLLRRDGRVCLLKRSPALDSAPGLWHVISGYLPEGLDPLQHAVVEIEQETGLRPAQVRLARTAQPVTFGGRLVGRSWRIHPFLFDLLEGEPRLNWEHTDLAWVSPEEVARYPCVPWLPTLVRHLLSSG